MASKAASKRLTKEYVAMQKDPPPFVYAVPEEKNILTWHYIIRGPPDSPYTGGEYHGVILFPSEYPFKPPGIKMITPSGRFQPDKKICFSMSDFHPGTWNPAWSVATILTGLLSFMLSDEMTTGSVTTSEADKRSLALRSHAFNRVNKRFKDAFPDYCDELPKDLPNMGEKERGTAEAPEGSATATTAPEASTSVAATAETAPLPPSTGPQATNPKPVVRRARGPVVVKGNGTVDTPGWAAAWRKTIWEKWRWGVLIAVAVIVSRLSS